MPNKSLDLEHVLNFRLAKKTKDTVSERTRLPVFVLVGGPLFSPAPSSRNRTENTQFSAVDSTIVIDGLAGDTQSMYSSNRVCGSHKLRAQQYSKWKQL